MTATSEMVLPTAAVPRKTNSPENVVIYSKPKGGKTTIATELEDYLLIDLEQGSNKVDAVKIQANNLNELAAWISKIKAANAKSERGYAYKYLVVDTATELESWCEWDATITYMKTPMGKKFNRVLNAADKVVVDENGKEKLLPRSKWLSVLTLPKGAGYLYLRNSYKKWINQLMELAPHVIFYAHVKDSTIDKKGKEVAVKDLDLTGKIKQITAQKADAIGYAFWEDGELMISFSTRDGVEASSRCEHLKDKVLPFKWENIFID